jgi:hypothetical protein
MNLSDIKLSSHCPPIDGFLKELSRSKKLKVFAKWITFVYNLGSFTPRVSSFPFEVSLSLRLFTTLANKKERDVGTQVSSGITP